MSRLLLAHPMWIALVVVIGVFVVGALVFGVRAQTGTCPGDDVSVNSGEGWVCINGDVVTRR